MPQPLILILTVIILFQAVPAWCETISQTYKISVTIPESVTLAGNASQSSSVGSAASASQQIQEQRLVRNHQPVVVRSILLP